MLLSCGDALIDFLPSKTADGREALTPAVGGSCLNIAIGSARLDVPTGFVGGISSDTFGRMIADHAAESGVDLSRATRSNRQATLAFARVTGTETQYAFYDADTASRNWTYRRDAVALDGITCLHTGSTTLVHDKGAAETLALIEDARPNVTISLDPNCRPNLVRDEDAYRARMLAFCGKADIVKMSDVDFAYLFGDEAYAARAEALLSGGASLVVITRGNDGACAWHRKTGPIAAEAPAVNVVDTIGAGDSFQAALLAALHRLGRIARPRLRDVSAAELTRALSFACKCAAFTCTRPGADPPRSRELPAGTW
ncbi:MULTISPECIES: carbohydrate kinase family protein [Bradyrhizobium]|uniref:Fructokinase n=1 Tax=Bradyrhizobium elkanii TaxID=29448 RepID=A0A8I2C1P7_BRAEL|nr:MULTISPECIES: carbohydrate kinase [Bradyrhizobium]MBP1294950.1 fructokinase [Bradyrhizobium elkanii]MCP1934148.1 fructokinase [Bradyrhizobium elkanii]MCS3477843.1 fructokinase [Bradyrhizobium elkanii]MCS3584617.1 fructokinase [Bradyrhizobium elkanii]MCS3718193.1 fructokinase [Bradyrhizobium elkanii]